MQRLIAPFGLGRREGGANENTRLSSAFNVNEVGTKVGTLWGRSLVFMKSLMTRAKTSIGATLLTIALSIGAIAMCYFLTRPREPDWFVQHKSDSILGEYQTAAVSTDSAPCAAIGKDILAKNGSAVDAAIAVLLCMGVVNPQSSGIGGGFLMLYYKRSENKTHYIDAREIPPKSADEDMFQGNASLAQFGGLSIAVPGEVKGFEMAHGQFGSLTWNELFQPTIKMCRKGIQVTPNLARALERNKEVFNQFEDIKKVFTNEKTGELYKVCDVYTREDLAATLEAIGGANNSLELYSRPQITANKLLDDLHTAGSKITTDDLQMYSVSTPTLIKKTLKNNLILHSVSFPGSGALLAFMLEVLGGYNDLAPGVNKTREGTVRTLHRMIETFKFANARRMDFGVNSKVEEKLISEEYARQVRDAINDTKTFSNVEHYGVNASVQDDHGGAHVSIIAPNGDAVSVTSSINSDFGSMILSPSTGIILNNQMNAFSLPNITESFGLPLTKMNRILREIRPFSSMSPAIVTDSNGDVVMAIGGTGGTQITSSMAQVIIKTLWFEENIKQAVDDRRLHHQLLPNYIEYEENFSKDILEDLEKMGHNVRPATNGVLGSVTGVVRHGPYLYANSDYRKGGGVDGF